ncbi:sulfate permease CysP [Marinithermofilum abyssi]|uniref:Sulfate permease CysP n=2 Tax=Marinithermofilum abyssi TaxID=1571185 RepID=A0A8J2VI18_9BACL|nr:sulfate permease CysP [Marinithermofilum abyssi]
MSLMIIIAYSVAFFFAMNIGASGAAASMGIAYGAGAVPRRRWALLLCGIGVFLGAVFGGGEVVKTIGSGLIPSSLITVKLAVIILSSAALSLFLANLLGIPLSTSEVTVGAVIGAGIAFQSFYAKKLLVVVSFWVLVPAAAFLLALAAGKCAAYLEGRRFRRPGWKKGLTFLLAGAGFLEAVSAGANNVANSVGPLVGAGLISVNQGVIFGGAFVALGAVLMGGKVLETNGKRITDITLLEGTSISATGGALVLAASFMGMPVPLTQVTTSAIIGIGTVKRGMSIWQKRVIVQMMKVWLVSPVISLVIAYGLVKVLIDGDLYSLIVVSSVFIATVGTISLWQSVRRERRSLHEHGGGI